MYIASLTLLKLYILNKMCYGIPSSFAEYALWRGVEYTCAAIYEGIIYLSMGCPPPYDDVVDEEYLHYNKDSFDPIKHYMNIDNSQHETYNINTPPAYTLINNSSSPSYNKSQNIEKSIDQDSIVDDEYDIVDSVDA